MNGMIKKIIEKNETDLLKRKSEIPVQDLERKIPSLPKALDFYGVFNKPRLPRRFAPRNDDRVIGIIAEIKLASPSAGDLARGDGDQILEIVNDYLNGGADAISVITEKYFFKGNIKIVKTVKEKTGLPILQKDFVVDPFQIYESRINNADALLLIAKIISPEELKKFVDLCVKIGLEPVVEINDEADLETALLTNTKIIAVNARDLDTFEVDLARACQLIGKIPKSYLKLAFSGVNSKQEVKKYKKSGADGILIGTSLMKSENKEKLLKQLR